jgi:hypothetical protein
MNQPITYFHHFYRDMPSNLTTMHQTSSPIQDQALAQQQAEEGSTILLLPHCSLLINPLQLP